MPKYPPSLKLQVVLLRQNGSSLKEISDEIGIAKSTASLWTRNIKLKQKQSSTSRIISTIRTKKMNKLMAERQLFLRADREIRNMSLSPSACKLLCSILLWTEGEKNRSSISFTNSDPSMVAAFLSLFRASYAIWV